MSIFSKKTPPATVEELNASTQQQINEAFFAAATKDNNIELAELLYLQGADVNYQDKDGNTALHIHNHNNFKMVKLLIETAKIDTEIRNNEGVLGEHRVNNHIQSYLQQQRERQKPTGWIKVTEDTIAHTVFGESLGYRLTEVFNFSSRTYVYITQNLETKAENKTLTVFDEFGNKSFLLNALEELKKQGGTAEESSISGKIHLAKDSFGAGR